MSFSLNEKQYTKLVVTEQIFLGKVFKNQQ